MRDAVLDLRPEIEWIADAELRERVLATWLLAFERSPLRPGDLEEIPFTLLVPGCPVSFLRHKRCVVHVARRSAEAMRELLGEALAIDLDTVIAGAVLADVGKLLEEELARWREQATRRELATARGTARTLDGGDTRLHKLDLSHMESKAARDMLKRELVQENHVWVGLTHDRSMLVASTSPDGVAREVVAEFTRERRFEPCPPPQPGAAGFSCPGRRRRSSSGSRPRSRPASGSWCRACR